ncbi:MAG: NTP transferase domain-containing protein [Acidobacteriota bacterium]|nr:NTP transferase domain-containing protein [Acidobacteriota bacterium]
MTKRLLIIPAAGLGSRLQADTPKLLYPVNGRPMLDYLFELYAPVVSRFVLVLHPAAIERVKAHCANLGLPVDFEVQESPTGMLDAILIPTERVRQHQPDQIWITWCDQVAVHPRTIRRLAEMAGEADAAMVMPTASKPEPYIHFERNELGDIVGLKQRREADDMPELGEGDLGLFCLTRAAYLDLLPRFSREAVTGSATQERNFLPFIPWLAGQQQRVRTFPAHAEIETIGINTKADLKLIETYLANGHQQTFRHHPGI